MIRKRKDGIGKGLKRQLRKREGRRTENMSAHRKEGNIYILVCLVWFERGASIEYHTIHTFPFSYLCIRCLTRDVQDRREGRANEDRRKKEGPQYSFFSQIHGSKEEFKEKKKKNTTERQNRSRPTEDDSIIMLASTSFVLVFP